MKLKKTIDINKLTKEFIFNLIVIKNRYNSKYFLDGTYYDFLIPSMSDDEVNSNHILQEMKICRINLFRLIFENLRLNSNLKISIWNSDENFLGIPDFNYAQIGVNEYYTEKHLTLQFKKYNSVFFVNKLSYSGYLKSKPNNGFPFEYIFENDEYNWFDLYDYDRFKMYIQFNKERFSV